MKKYGLLVLCLIVGAILLSACKIKQPSNTINYHRKLEKYLPSEQPKQHGGAIDLSEGPRLKYDAKFGPSDMNFDVKIVNPY